MPNTWIWGAAAAGLVLAVLGAIWLLGYLIACARAQRWLSLGAWWGGDGVAVADGQTFSRPGTDGSTEGTGKP